jgi:flagellar basal-body rod protein FlgG
MSNTMIQAAVTMNQLQKKMDVIGNNMANSDTNGYKARQSEFASLLYQQINNLSAPANAEGRLTPEGIRVGAGAKLGTAKPVFTQGVISETGRALDAALLSANHLFQIEVSENGTAEIQYTRDGAFYLNPVNNDQDVMLTTKEGYPVIGENGPVVIPQDFDAIAIQPDGTITVQRGNQTEQAGNIAIVQAVQPGVLEAAGQNYFRLADDAGYAATEIIREIPAGTTVLNNEALEKSNVDIAKQMTDMVMTQRSYQFNARTISTGDQMAGLINQLR